MDQIKIYFITIFKVFLLLSSVFILFNILKIIILKIRLKKKARNNNKMRGNYVLYKSVEKEDNCNKFIDTIVDYEKVYKYKNGDLYKGEFLGEKRHGFGVCVFSNKEKYEGLWNNDYMHSIGKYTYNDGSTYSGDFRNGVAQGIGTYTYKNKDIYKGQFINNKKEGKGVLYYNDGSKYIGMWKDNVKSGYGKLIIKNGDLY